MIWICTHLKIVLWNGKWLWWAIVEGNGMITWSVSIANAIWQPNLDIVAVVSFLSVSIWRCVASFPHLSFAMSHVVCCPLFSFQQTSIPFLSPILCFSLFPLPLFFFHHPRGSPSSTVIGRKSYLFSAAEKFRQMSLIMCPLHSVSISEESGTKKERGEMAHLHVCVFNLTAKPSW